MEEKLIYFDGDKQPYNAPIPYAIATCTLEQWIYYSQECNADKWDIIDGVFKDITDTAEYIQKQEQKETERIAMLHMTGADVERAIYKAFNKDFDDIKAELEVAQIPNLDLKALNIELKANEFYRGNNYISAVGQFLGITEDKMTQFFETKDYKALMPTEV